MKIISHRGNLEGINPTEENQQDYIESAILEGFDVEVDLRFLDGNFWLGHDTAQYKISLDWIKNRSNFLWFHCKDQESAIKLLEFGEKDFKFFCHSNDKFVLTNNGYLWVHDLNSSINNRCIIPLLSESDIESYRGSKPGYICTDYPKKLFNFYG